MDSLPVTHNLDANHKITGTIGAGPLALLAGRLTLALGSILTLCLPATAAPAPRAHGVIFFCPPKAESAIAELKKIQADGYNLVEFASWPWTLPTSGSQMETTVTAVLNWCDAHDMHFFLMHNVQYDASDGAYENPMGALVWLTDWLRVMKGHKCVAGVMLGNEVGPAAGKPKENPKWWAGFIADLKARHKTIEALNAAWGTHFADFGAVTPPKAGSPGVADYNRFAVQAFDRFYGILFHQALEPSLGKIFYSPKTMGDPPLHRACTNFSMICWDDALSDYPQWRIKAMGDVSRMTGKAVFNSELHLYHEGYAFFGSPAKSRYRYFLSALNGEWMTASFAWGQWNNPGTQAIHRATPTILADLRRLEPQLRAFSKATPEVHVVLSGPWAGDDVTAQRLYTEIANLGAGWEFVCPEDISRIAAGAVYIPKNTRLSLDACQALADLPASVRIVLAESNAMVDEYGHPVPARLRETIAHRACTEYGAKHLIVGDGERLTSPYADPAEVSYAAWSPERGHFGYPMVYPRLEARRVPNEKGWLVAVINHATGGKPVRAKLPWSKDKGCNVCELTAGGGPVDPNADQLFAPLDVRVYQYPRKPASAR